MRQRKRSGELPAHDETRLEGGNVSCAEQEPCSGRRRPMNLIRPRRPPEPGSTSLHQRPRQNIQDGNSPKQGNSKQGAADESHRQPSLRHSLYPTSRDVELPPSIEEGCEEVHGKAPSDKKGQKTKSSLAGIEVMDPGEKERVPAKRGSVDARRDPD